jgi:transcriptional regulator with XRE-family HTH domain
MYQERIKQIRSELGLSVAKLADKINIPARTITGYERGERTPSIEFLSQCCTVLNLNANWFVSGEGNMFNPPQFEQVQDELALKVRSILREEGLIK